MNNIVLSDTNTHKHLGLNFSSSCTWSNHVNDITAKAWTRLNLMRALKFRISRKALEQMYVAFILPLLEYCDSVWDNCSAETKNKLEAVHIEAARVITGATKLCSIEKLLADLGWESLQDRRNKHKLVIFYKIVNHIAPNYLSDLVPPLTHETNRYNLRNANDIRNFHANTNLYYNSFFPSTIRAWNNLSEETKQVTTVSAFKYRLNSDLQKPPKYFNAGSRIGQILHSRIRLECSSLGSHLYMKNIIPDPSCRCGSFESAYHFFFICPMFTDARARYLPNNLHNYTLRDFLFGMTEKTIPENEELFIQVQNFIIKSGRFA